MGLEYGGSRQWTFESLEGGATRTTALRLHWEVCGDPISDNYTPSDMDAADLLALWVNDCLPDHVTEQAFGAGAARITWFVEGDQSFEAAPFQVPPDAPDEDFLTFYTWPGDSASGERLCWNRLPVIDKLWRPGRSDKGGFIQESTGWKPSPLQPAVYVPQLLAAAGLASR